MEQWTQPKEGLHKKINIFKSCGEEGPRGVSLKHFKNFIEELKIVSENRSKNGLT